MSFPQGTSAALIEIAKAEIGTIEEGDNLTKYGKFTKADGLPWCGSFVNWCAAQAGVKIHSVVSTAAGAHRFKEMQRWSNMPQLGYLAFMDFPHDGVDRISHIGIVVGLAEFMKAEAAAGPSRREKIEQAAATLDIKDKIASKRADEQLKQTLAGVDYKINATMAAQKAASSLEGKTWIDSLKYVSENLYKGTGKGLDSTSVIEDTLRLKYQKPGV